ncbi:hypothetical protein [Pseudorhodoferax sp. Leaf267]|uniref:hypothetical protein n=1 Tax=Pseudorhodoferax sp. Leaf267 TaxID=1736316 RepID=UPI0012E2A678|nr:hypothetical protein [Pseudorhodoferax sp. Leaf267]
MSTPDSFTVLLAELQWQVDRVSMDAGMKSRMVHALHALANLAAHDCLDSRHGYRLVASLIECSEAVPAVGKLLRHFPASP